MVNIAIVFHSGFGHTKAIAQALQKGASEIEKVTTHLLEITHLDIKDGRWNNDAISGKLKDADAIVLGSPTYMGGVTSVFKAFLEWCFYPWLNQEWKNKLAAGFTNSASQSGDKLNTLVDLQVFASQMGMLWIPVGDLPANNWTGGSVNDINRLGSWVGLMSQSPDDIDTEESIGRGDWLTSYRFGEHIAKTTLQWKGEQAYEPEKQNIKAWQKTNQKRVQNEIASGLIKS